MGGFKKNRDEEVATMAGYILELEEENDKLRTRIAEFDGKPKKAKARALIDPLPAE